VSELSESQLRYIHLGKKVDIEIPSIGLVTEGNITSIIPSSNPMTHKFKIKMRFESNGRSSVYPGMYAKIMIK